MKKMDTKKRVLPLLLVLLMLLAFAPIGMGTPEYDATLGYDPAGTQQMETSAEAPAAIESDLAEASHEAENPKAQEGAYEPQAEAFEGQTLKAPDAKEVEEESPVAEVKENPAASADENPVASAEEPRNYTDGQEEDEAQPTPGEETTNPQNTAPKGAATLASGLTELQGRLYAAFEDGTWRIDIPKGRATTLHFYLVGTDTQKNDGMVKYVSAGIEVVLNRDDFEWGEPTSRWFAYNDPSSPAISNLIAMDYLEDYSGRPKECDSRVPFYSITVTPKEGTPVGEYILPMISTIYLDSISEDHYAKIGNISLIFNVVEYTEPDPDPDPAGPEIDWTEGTGTKFVGSANAFSAFLGDGWRRIQVVLAVGQTPVKVTYDGIDLYWSSTRNCYDGLVEVGDTVDIETVVAALVWDDEGTPPETILYGDFNMDGQLSGADALATLNLYLQGVSAILSEEPPIRVKQLLAIDRERTNSLAQSNCLQILNMYLYGT